MPIHHTPSRVRPIKYILSILVFLVIVSIPRAEMTASSVSPIAHSDTAGTTPTTTKKITHRRATYTPTQEEVRAAVIAEFGEGHVMVRVAGCEGKFYQIDPKTGEALRGYINPLDRGVFQINEHYHLADSIAMGIDIMTLDGNIKYARYLYDHQGTRPWNWSRACWGQ